MNTRRLREAKAGRRANLPLQIAFLADTKIQIAGYHTELIRFLKLVKAAHVENLTLPRVPLQRVRARLGVRIQNGPAVSARLDEMPPVRRSRKMTG